MEIYNRSAITVTAKKPFIDWNNSLTPEMPMNINLLGESHTYLAYSGDIDHPIPI